jgi:hypothetical protein
MAWSHDVAHGTTHEAGLPGDDNNYRLTVVDVFGNFSLSSICLLTHPNHSASHTTDLKVTPVDKFLCPSFMRQGIIPSSPGFPTLGFSIPTLELFCVMHNRCPHLSQQAFVKTLSDLHSVRDILRYKFDSILIVIFRSNIKSIDRVNSLFHLIFIFLSVMQSTTVLRRLWCEIPETGGSDTHAPHACTKSRRR